tara:strand:+ start:1117 stop:1380 length:264 start_codon:yes stop_codon:yes gene_type:complete
MGAGAYPPPPRSEVSFNLSEAPQDGGAYQSTYRDNQVENFEVAQREIMSMGLNQEQMDPNFRKIESKDSMWKPAPIMGREMTNQINM